MIATYWIYNISSLGWALRLISVFGMKKPAVTNIFANMISQLQEEYSLGSLIWWW